MTTGPTKDFDGSEEDPEVLQIIDKAIGDVVATGMSEPRAFAHTLSYVLAYLVTKVGEEGTRSLIERQIRLINKVRKQIDEEEL